MFNEPALTTVAAAIRDRILFEDRRALPANFATNQQEHGMRSQSAPSVRTGKGSQI
jgi:hypothetical protein